MSIQTEEELRQLRVAGMIVRQALNAMTAAVEPGITTAELDAICARVLADNGASSAPRKVYNFPGACCISVNDEAIHGVPGSRLLADGDLVKLDVTAEKDGYYADAAVTLRVGTVSDTASALMRCAESAFRQAMRAAKAGARVYEIGRAVQREVRSHGFNVLPEYGGHGIGRTIHELPHVPNYPDLTQRALLHPGLVLALEPIIATGSGRSFVGSDGWTVRTSDHSLAAHYEHTVVITKGTPYLITA
ncbi:MAG: type I methionyl aminopeptidase [Candidatus Korobacteraceae bacterium]